MTRCSICTHPNVTAIDDLLDGGATQKEVAAQFNVSPYALSRHVRHTVPAENPVTTPLDEVAKWLKRADDQYLLAVADADQRGAVAALVAGLRAVETRVREEARAAEAEPAELPSNVNDWTPTQATQFLNFVDNLIREAEARPSPEDIFATAEATRKDPDLHTIFVKLRQNPDWKRRTQQFCAEMFTEETGEKHGLVSQIAN